jgi:hypothetical protein
LIFLTGDTGPNKEKYISNDAYYLPPKTLPGFPGTERVARKGGMVRWKLPDGSIGEEILIKRLDLQYLWMKHENGQINKNQII